MNVLKKIRLLRERLGLSLTQAKEALIISLEGVTLDDHQEVIAEDLETLLAEAGQEVQCPSCKGFYTPTEKIWFSGLPRLRGKRFCTKHCLRVEEAKCGAVW